MAQSTSFLGSDVSSYQLANKALIAGGKAAVDFRKVAAFMC